VRAVVFREYRYSEGIGPNGTGVYAMGSETEFTQRAEQGGHRCWHFHASPVGHIIRPHQLTPEWLLQRAYNLGRGERRRSGIGKRDVVASLIGYPTHLRPRMVKAVANFAVAQMFGTSDDRFKALLKLRYLDGDFAERRALSKARRTEAIRGLIGRK
jgi:L-malate glycosyltransferase